MSLAMFFTLPALIMFFLGVIFGARVKAALAKVRA